MKTFSFLLPASLLICLSLAACDSGTGIEPDGPLPASRHGSTVVAPDAAGYCGEATGQLDTETSAAQRHLSGRNPDCFEYQDMTSADTPADETDEHPIDEESPKPDPRLD